MGYSLLERTKDELYNNLDYFLRRVEDIQTLIVCADRYTPEIVRLGEALNCDNLQSWYYDGRRSRREIREFQYVSTANDDVVFCVTLTRFDHAEYIVENLMDVIDSSPRLEFEALDFMKPEPTIGAGGTYVLRVKTPDNSIIIKLGLHQPEEKCRTVPTGSYKTVQEMKTVCQMGSILY